MGTRDITVGLAATTAYQTIYTSPAMTSIESIVISNASSSSVTFSLQWYNYRISTLYTIADQVKIPGNSIIQLSNCIGLLLSSFLSGKASVNNAVTFTVYAKETYISSSYY